MCFNNDVIHYGHKTIILYVHNAMLKKKGPYLSIVDHMPIEKMILPQ